MLKIFKHSAVLIIVAVVAVSIAAQKKPRKPKPKKTPAAAAKVIAAEVTAPVVTPPKKNERPAEEESQNEAETGSEPQKTNQNGKSNQRPATNKDAFQPVYFYEFSQPKFVISKINIEHDENGKGKISFVKKDFDEPVSDPIQVSAAALERIKTALDALAFLTSTESYQYEKDYSHLGNVTFKIKRAEGERETKFNYTTNENAKILANEYRKIGNQFVWMFDISVARENQPLDAPRLLDTLDSYLRRNEISDAAQMLPFLKELGDDERIPLIARNHAKRLAEKIEKEKSKTD